MRFASATNYPQGTAWATHAALTPQLVNPRPRFGLFPNDPSASSLALTAAPATSAADLISWAFMAGLVGFVGFVGYQALWGKK